MFSAKNGKVFIFLVKLYKRVFHPNIFSHMVNFLSLWGWEGDWSPTSHQLVTLPYFMCGDWSHCMTHCLSILHGVLSADIRKGDTLGEPQHVEQGELMRFDRVIANPPFSLKNWGRDLAEHDGFGRYRFGIPPKDAGDLAFVQHMIASLNQEGIMGVVVPHGVLFRGGAEGQIRKGILEDDLIEAVIGLPSGLFYGTGIPAALLIINKSKPSQRRGKVLFINAELGYEEGKNQNTLRDRDIEKVVKCFDAYNEIKRFSRVVPLEEMRGNDHNLNIRRYADTSPPPEPFDVRGILHGGVPIQEIEGDYIQKILDGFDVSVVLAPKDAEYLKNSRTISKRNPKFANTWEMLQMP